MTQIFVSYRRSDSIKDTGRMYDWLAHNYGKNSVFKDVDSTPLGADFRGIIKKAVARCDVLLVVIGPDWLYAQDEQGRRRLDNPDDFVRIEVETGLQRDGCVVIPVLLNNATMPTYDALPESLKDLTYRQAQQVRDDPDFHTDMDRLIKGITDNLTTIHTRPRTEQAGSGSSVQVHAPAVERPVNLSFNGAVDKRGYPFGWFNGAVYVSGVSFGYAVSVVPRPDGQHGTCVLLSGEEVLSGDFGVIMQRCLGQFLAGKTIRLTGEIAAQEVGAWAGFWIRADAEYEPNLFFDNMHRNPIAGTRPWDTYTLEALLPLETVWLNFGLVLTGTGAIWADNLRLSVWQNNEWKEI